jgi:hypothetical protein
MKSFLTFLHFKILCIPISAWALAPYLSVRLHCQSAPFKSLKALPESHKFLGNKLLFRDPHHSIMVPKDSEVNTDSSPKAESSPALGKLLYAIPLGLRVRRSWPSPRILCSRFSNPSTTKENATACDKDEDQTSYYPSINLGPTIQWHDSWTRDRRNSCVINYIWGFSIGVLLKRCGGSRKCWR